MLQETSNNAPHVQGRATINDMKVYLWSIAIYLYLHSKKLLRTHAVLKYNFPWFFKYCGGGYNKRNVKIFDLKNSNRIIKS